MRTIIFLSLVICLGTQLQAQKKSSNIKVPSVVMPLANVFEKSIVSPQDFQTAARFFKVKNARVKQALRFKPRFRKTVFA